MAISKQQFTQLIKQSELKKLFIQLGWNADNVKFKEKAGDEIFDCESIVEKSGFKILLVKPANALEIPVYATRKKISNAITKRYRENLIIFINERKTKQQWHFTLRRPGKPALTSEIPYYINQDPELLFQKLQGIFFYLDEEDNITIVDVSQRVSDSFEKNAKDVVKKFYREFQLQHRSFLKFIKGIKEQVNQEWYASLMLNRLMFCYFIQKKGFLDSDIDYLQNKLKDCGEKFGKDKFYSFYRTFLLTLFHKGLGSPTDERKKKEIEILGNIPYLNGGLFDEHIIERENQDSIQIKDEAFTNIFNFFDDWNWYLDTREHATGNNINPDVIGYIFEQYINERAAMGAYYTREDITDYISKNCIFPWLIEETSRHYPTPFEKNGEFFTMIKKSGDTYVYPAVKHGISWNAINKEPLQSPAPVPANIEKGIDTHKPNLLERRADWNSPAPAEAALPTEIWREVMERRKRYEELTHTIQTGGIAHINDCITWNLNITQIVHDWLANTNDAIAIEHFYKALNSITILDPTCGSGAFLFAALNLLEPLYEACLMRMRSYVEDEDRQNAADRQNFKNAHKFFRKILADVQQPVHPSQEYFILKSIILRNLYGVDIMNEAVEIAKLRLFLKLVATVTPNPKKENHGLEPLPDIDFNIRCGNTLIGFATMAQMKEGLRYDIEGAAHLPHIEEQCDLIISRAFEHFKTIQLTYGEDHKSFKTAKRDLQKKLDNLNEDLNTFLAKTYSIIDKEKQVLIEIKEGKESKKKRVNQYQHWLDTHQPFHWFAEYYEIIEKRKGFDVIIGNPPYVELKSAEKNYLIKEKSILHGGNLHSITAARSNSLLNKRGSLGFIVPLAISNTERMASLRKIFQNESTIWLTHYSIRPSKLFSGAEQRLTIYVLHKSQNQSNFIFSSRYYKWHSEERSYLFQKLALNKLSTFLPNAIWLKSCGSLTASVFEKTFKFKKKIEHFSNGLNSVFYKNTGVGYFIPATINPPKCFINGVKQSSSRETTIKFPSIQAMECFHSIICSSTYFHYYQAISNCRDLNPSDLSSFPIPDSILSESMLSDLSKQLSKSLEDNSWFQIRTQKQTGEVKINPFRFHFPNQSSTKSTKC